MKINFLRVMGARSRGAVVLATVDGCGVRWNPRRGWDCECDTDGDACPHVDAVAELLDPRVTEVKS
jgi:hypothetical protein